MEQTDVFHGAPAALAALQPRLTELSSDDVQAPRADAPRVVGNVVRVARSYSEDRVLFVRTFTKAGFDVTRYDDLEPRALALWQADVDYRQMIEPQGSLSDVLAQALPMRKKLLRAAVYLWEDHEVLGPQVAEIRDGRGHLDTADDLVALPTLFETQWHAVADQCAITRQDLSEARGLGLELMHLLHPANKQKAIQEARDLRNRAYTHAVQGARDVRLAAAFVFRDRPERLEAYPNPLTPMRRRAPAPNAQDSTAEQAAEQNVEQAAEQALARTAEQMVATPADQPAETLAS